MIDANNAVDIVKKINQFFDNNGDQHITDMMHEIDEMSRILDGMERFAQSMPSEYFKNRFMNNLVDIRKKITDMIDAVDHMYDTVNK